MLHKKIKKIVLISLFSFAMLAALLLLTVYRTLSRKIEFDSPYFLSVARGETAYQVATKLAQDEIINSEFMFKLLLRFSAPIKAGEYELAGTLSMRDIKNILVTGGAQQQTKITIAEGRTVLQIKEILNNNHNLIGVADLDVAEGYLLPETYNVTRGTMRNDVLKIMQQHMEKVLAEEWQNRAHDFFKTPEEALILASIVEKETGVAVERPLIASVFINRLKRGMRLQADPTIVYEITGKLGDMKGQRLWKKYFAVDSPFNTHKYPGLPPTPIANPGRAAINAVLHPADTAFLYFVADGTGGHIFAQNLREHNENVRKWHEYRRDQGI